MPRTRIVELRITFDDEMMASPESWEWEAILQRARLDGVLKARVNVCNV